MNKRVYKYRMLYSASYRKEIAHNYNVGQSVPGVYTTYDKALTAARSTPYFIRGEYSEKDIVIRRFRGTPHQFEQAA